MEGWSVSRNVLGGEYLFQMCSPLWADLQAAHVFPAAEDFDLQVDVLNYLKHNGVTDDAVIRRVMACIDLKALSDAERLILLVDPARHQVVLTFVFACEGPWPEEECSEQC